MRDKLFGKIIISGYGLLVWNIIKYTNNKPNTTDKDIDKVIKDALLLVK